MYRCKYILTTNVCQEYEIIKRLCILNNDHCIRHMIHILAWLRETIASNDTDTNTTNNNMQQICANDYKTRHD